MPDVNKMTLDQLQTGHKGRIIEIKGGHGFINRLDAIGIRTGKIITKKGSMLMRGPVTIQVDNAQIAIGFGMAKKIVVEPAKK